jgi:hypothetical protein
MSLCGQTFEPVDGSREGVDDGPAAAVINHGGEVQARVSKS